MTIKDEDVSSQQHDYLLGEVERMKAIFQSLAERGVVTASDVAFADLTVSIAHLNRKIGILEAAGIDCSTFQKSLDTMFVEIEKLSQQMADSEKTVD